MTSEIDELNKMVTEAFKYVGLDIFKHEILESMMQPGSHALHLNLMIDMDPNISTNENVINKLKEITASISESTYIGGQIRTLQGQLDNLKAENEDLKKYETYYKMAKGLK